MFLVLLWFTWLLSTLIAYWGAPKASVRLLVVFGAVVLAFAIVSNLGSEWTGWTALLFHPLIALPLFGLAWLSRRWPRIAGLFLLTLAVFFFRFFEFFDRDNIAKIDDAVVFTLLLGPLLATGFALLAAGKQSEESDDLDEVVLAGE